MKAVEVSGLGVPHEVCACVEVDAPGDPAAGEIVVEIIAAPINPADLLGIEGKYPGPVKFPARLGIEGVGTIIAAGSDVTGLAVGDRVISLERANWAQRITLKQDRAIKVPAGGDPLQQAMSKANPPSAMLMLADYVDLKKGDWVIQNAANSGVGIHLIRLARARGLHTVNVVRRESLIDRLGSEGGDVVVVDGDDLAARVAAETGGAEIRLAIDAVGGAATMRLADCLAEGATVVNYGFLSGQPCQITPTQTIIRGIKLVGFWLVREMGSRGRDDVKRIFAEVSAAIADGTLAVPIEAEYDIADIKQALEHAGREGRDGKILVLPNGPVS